MTLQPDDIDFTHILKDPEDYAQNLSINELEQYLMLFKSYYYNTDTPLVPDHIYDEMEDVLRSRAPDSKVLSTVGAQLLPSQRKTKLPYPMASQDKAKAESGDLEKWLKKPPASQAKDILVSDKLDGISLMYYYRKGQPAKLYTRGTTFEGQDVSHLLRHGLQISTQKGNKLSIPGENEEVAVRGELIMEKDTWDKYYASQYPNVRNWIAGQVAHKTSKPEHLKHIRFVAYQLVYPEEILPADQFKTMKNWGYYVAPNKLYSRSQVDEKTLIKHLKESKSKNPYQIDGLVVTANLAFAPTDKNPKHSIAFKSQIGEQVEAKVTRVEWNASKLGILKPIVHIEPVFLSGANISKASGINAKYIKDNDIGPGAVVEIIRSGEVIPYIMSVVIPADKASFPDYLNYEWSPSGVEIQLTKKDLQQSTQVVQKRLEHFVKTIEIDNLGPGTIKKLVEYSNIRQPIEIFFLTLDDLKEVPSLGKNAEKINQSLQNVIKERGVSLAQLIDSFGVFGTGGVGSRRVQSVLNVIPAEDLLELASKTDPKSTKELQNKLLKVEGIQKKTSEKMTEGFQTFMTDIFYNLPDDLMISDFQADEDSEDTNIIKNPKMDKMRFIFTGVRAKPDLQKLIKDSGGTSADSVIKTDPNQLVIAKDPSSNSGKIKKARDQGVDIISMDEFSKRFKLSDYGISV